MRKNKIILIGAGGHAKSCIDAIESQSRFQIAGIVGVESEVGKKICGYEIIATDSHLPQLAKSYSYALISVGQIRSHEGRKRLFEMAQSAGFEMATIIASTSYVSRHARIQAGTIVLHGAVVNTGTTVGENCIINSNALLEHDVKVARHCHISTGAVVNGNVSIGEGCFVGSGTVIREGLSIGSYSIVGMASSVIDSLHSESYVPNGDL